MIYLLFLFLLLFSLELLKVFFGAETLICSVEIAVGVEFVVAKDGFLRSAEGTLQFFLYAFCLLIITFEASETNKVDAVTAG